MEAGQGERGEASSLQVAGPLWDCMRPGLRMVLEGEKDVGTRTQPLDSWRMMDRMKRGSVVVADAMVRMAVCRARVSGRVLGGTW